MLVRRSEQPGAAGILSEPFKCVVESRFMAAISPQDKECAVLTISGWADRDGF